MALRVLLHYNDEAKFATIDPAMNKSSLISTFHTLFQDRSASILQCKMELNGSWIFVNVEDRYFKISSEIKELRLIPSREERLGLGNLNPSTSLVFCCDMQERFRPAIEFFDKCVDVGSRVLEAADLLQIPVVVTEQYPRGLGNTVSDLSFGENSIKVEKTKFSMIVPEVEAFLNKHCEAKSVVLFGVETHVCVQQTVLDLLKRGYDVHVVADATSSRSLSDRQLAFKRFRRLGAHVTSCETVLLQWVADKQHEQFKAIQGLIKELPRDTGLLVKSTM